MQLTTELEIFINIDMNKCEGNFVFTPNLKYQIFFHLKNRIEKWTSNYFTTKNSDPLQNRLKKNDNNNFSNLISAIRCGNYFDWNHEAKLI